MERWSGAVKSGSNLKVKSQVKVHGHGRKILLWRLVRPRVRSSMILTTANGNFQTPGRCARASKYARQSSLPSVVHTRGRHGGTFSPAPPRLRDAIAHTTSSSTELRWTGHVPQSSPVHLSSVQSRHVLERRTVPNRACLVATVPRPYLHCVE